MATLEELTVVATQEIEDAKPLYKQVNSQRLEFTDADYDQAIVDLANSKFDQQENGYKTARQEAYNSIQDQLDMQYWDSVNSTTTWADHIAQVKSDNPKPS
jgi:hypothetical protein|tara:strand:+ start:62 stop:364 length:303 start_codon:yes stop_codon:yes gene_type:complete